MGPCYEGIIHRKYYVTGNIAYGRDAEAYRALDEYIPGNAVDGDVNHVLSAGTCFQHAPVSQVAWWKINLGSQHVIYNVTLHTPGKTKQITTSLPEI